jgi:hypothetical protein
VPPADWPRRRSQSRGRRQAGWLGSGTARFPGGVGSKWAGRRKPGPCKALPSMALGASPRCSPKTFACHISTCRKPPEVSMRACRSSRRPTARVSPLGITSITAVRPRLRVRSSSSSGGSDERGGSSSGKAQRSAPLSASSTGGAQSPQTSSSPPPKSQPLARVAWFLSEGNPKEAWLSARCGAWRVHGVCGGAPALLTWLGASMGSTQDECRSLRQCAHAPCRAP